jgi:hypothetical protein
MDNSMTIALIAIGAVAALALLMRRGGKDEVVHRPPGANEVFAGDEVAEAGSTAVALEELDDEDDEEGDAALANARLPVTSEGIALLPDGEDVRMIPMLDSEQVPDWVRKAIDDSAIPYSMYNHYYGYRPSGAKPGYALSSGDFTAARVRRGEGGTWLVETLGRDGDFGFFPFETEAGARAAFDLLEHQRIIQHALDEYGEPIPSTPEDFEEARRRYDETERDLALDTDEPPPGDWSSRR